MQQQGLWQDTHGASMLAPDTTAQATRRRRDHSHLCTWSASERAIRTSCSAKLLRFAGVAQLVEQLIRNEKVEGSTPFSGTRDMKVGRSASANLFSFCTHANVQPGSGPDHRRRTFSLRCPAQAESPRKVWVATPEDRSVDGPTGILHLRPLTHTRCISGVSEPAATLRSTWCSVVGMDLAARSGRPHSVRLSSGYRCDSLG